MNVVGPGAHFGCMIKSGTFMAAFAVGAERIQAVGVKGRHAPKGISGPIT